MFHLHSQIPLFHRFNKIGNGNLVLLFQTTKCIILVVVIGTILHQKVEFIQMLYSPIQYDGAVLRVRFLN